MGCLRVKELNEYLVSPLKEAILEDDPYVQKTAVMTVAKIYYSNPELIIKNGLIKEMLIVLDKSKNPIVLSNTLLALHEMESRSGEKFINFSSDLIKKIMKALPEC